MKEVTSSKRACSPSRQMPNEDLAVPDHLKAMFDASRANLSDEESKKLSKLLRDYQDVFAKNEFDLGNFTAIEHGIDTGDAKPVKERMRRTPACFAGEEEAHLRC